MNRTKIQFLHKDTRQKDNIDNVINNKSDNIQENGISDTCIFSINNNEDRSVTIDIPEYPNILISGSSRPITSVKGIYKAGIIGIVIGVTGFLICKTARKK